MTDLIPQALPQIVVGRLLNGALEGFALAALAGASLKVVGRRSSSTRFAVWFLVLLTVGALPWMDSLHRGASALSPGVSPMVSMPAIFMIPEAWARGMFYLWGAVAFVLLSRVVLGLWQIRRLRRSSLLLDPATLNPALRQALQAGCHRSMSLHVAESVRVPMATGFFRPIIVIPAWALCDLSVDELKVVLLHEAAHLQRWDDWTNLAQKLVRALFFFHPLVWWLEGKLSLEREMACDDLVVASTATPRAYAECLVTLAEKSLGRRNLALAQAAVNRVRHTSLRIRQILNGERSGATGVSKPAVAFAATAALASLLFVNEAPKLVAFTSPAVEAQRPMLAVTQAGTLSATSAASYQRTAYPFSPAKLKVKRRVRSAPPVRWKTNEIETAANTSPNTPGIVPPTNVMALEDAPTYRGVAFTSEETIFVVTQDQQYDDAGDKVVRFNVYRLTVFYPEFYPSNSRKTLSKSI